MCARVQDEFLKPVRIGDENRGVIFSIYHSGSAGIVGILEQLSEDASAGWTVLTDFPQCNGQRLTLRIVPSRMWNHDALKTTSKGGSSCGEIERGRAMVRVGQIYR